MKIEECKQCHPCLMNILSAQDQHQHAVNELNALLAESDNLSSAEREILRSIRTYISLAHNALNHVFDGQGRTDLKQYASDKLKGDNAWGGKKNAIREKVPR